MTNKPNRRDALKALTAATGALSLAALPDEWTTPVINAGALPPHAQTSCWGLIVELVSVTGEVSFDIDSQTPVDPTRTEGTELEEGWKLFWECQDTCVIIYLGSVGDSARWLVTPIGQDPFYSSEDGHYILINLMTGEYALDDARHPSCQWPA